MINEARKRNLTVERRFICNVVNQQNTHGSTVISYTNEKQIKIGYRKFMIPTYVNILHWRDKSGFIKYSDTNYAILPRVLHDILLCDVLISLNFLLVTQIVHSKALPVVIVRNRSWPAVSQICSLIRLPSSSMVLILKSILQKKYKLKHVRFLI